MAGSSEVSSARRRGYSVAFGLAKAVLLALAAIGLMGLVACISSTPTPAATSTPVQGLPSSSATLAATAAPHQDVHQEATDALLSQGSGIAYSRLLRLRSGPDVRLPSLEVECDLCARWEHPDPLTYVFYLRQGVRWQNIEPVKGRELTARDVAYSLDRLRTPGWPGASLLQAVDSVKATGSYTVNIKLRYPDADFLLALADGQAKIVAPEAVKVHGDLLQGPTIGTGPWILKQVASDGLMFEANPSYYEPGLPKLQGLKVVPISDPTTRLAAVLAGQADLASVSIEEWDRAIAFQSRINIGAFPQPGTGVLFGLKAGAAPFDAVDVRRTAFQSLDPWSALDKVWKGSGDAGVGIPVPSDWLLPQDEMRRFLGNGAQTDVALPLAHSVSVNLKVADYGNRYLALGQEYRRMLEAAGFQVTVDEVNPRVYAEDVWGKGDFQAFLGPMPPVHSSNDFLLSVLHSQGRWAITGYADQELDRLIQAQSVTEQGRGEIVLDIQRRVLDNAVMFMPVTGTSLWVWQKRVEGFAPNFAASEYFHWARISVRQ